MARKKKKLVNNEHGEIAGYVRKSVVEFPDNCLTVQERRAYVDDLRRVRVAELENDASRDGHTITRWYDDMDVSGKGEFLEKRISFHRLTKDAKEGAVRMVYARDLSRVMRGVVEQELWLDEMIEDYGCAVICPDLPRTGHASMDKYARQQFGAMHEYLATRNSEVVSASLAEIVDKGIWIGRGRSVWGLRYTPGQKKALEYDPETAPFIIRLFEDFIAFGGNGNRLADHYNRLILRESPEALKTPHGSSTWNATRILRIIRSSVYQRSITHVEKVFDRRDCIPEVVAPEEVAEALRLANKRSIVSRKPGRRHDFVYSGLLTCGCCGAPMRSSRAETSVGVVYICRRARASRALCPDSYGIGHPRIDAMVGRALRQWLAEAADRIGSAITRRQRAKTKPKVAESIEEQLAALDAEAARCQQMYKEQQPFPYSWEQFMADGANIGQRRKEVLARSDESEVAQPPPESYTPDEWREMQERFEAVWGAEGGYDCQEKAVLLRTIGVTAIVTVHPTVRTSEKTGRRISGKASALVRIGDADPYTVRIKEDEATYQRWRRERPHLRNKMTQ